MIKVSCDQGKISTCEEGPTLISLSLGCVISVCVRSLDTIQQFDKEITSFSAILTKVREKHLALELKFSFAFISCLTPRRDLWQSFNQNASVRKSQLCQEFDRNLAKKV